MHIALPDLLYCTWRPTARCCLIRASAHHATGPRQNGPPISGLPAGKGYRFIGILNSLASSPIGVTAEGAADLDIGGRIQRRDC